MEKTLEQVYHFLSIYGLQVIGAIIILILGRIAAGIARKITERALNKAKTDFAVTGFVSSLVYTLILVFAVIAALTKFGVNATSFVAVLGAAGLAIGLALQGSLANFAAGVLILVLRPFKVGDYIMGAGEAGTVKAIYMFITELSTPDNIKVMIPNSKLFGDVIKNVSAYDTRRVDFVFGIGYSSDIQKAYDVLSDILKNDSRVLPDPPFQIAVSELADSSVNFIVRPWVKKEDYWDVKFDVTRKVKEAFDANGIEIPFPQVAMHAISTN